MPMMDVVMTILTFFIIVSMTLSKSNTVKNVALPQADRGNTQENLPDPLVIGVDRQGQALVDNASVNEAQIGQKVVEYLNKNPNGAIVLKADKSLAYEKVVKTLGVVREVGGDRVSLAVE